MPIPFILLAIGGATALVGAGKTIKAAVDTSDAKDYNRWANNKIDDAKKNLEVRRKASSTALEALGGKKLFVLDKGVTRFVSTYEKLKNVELEASPGLDKLKMDKQSFDGLKEMSRYAASILGGTAAGVVGGGLAAFGAYGGAHLLATSGVLFGHAVFGAAATNATLAFLGGGSLAAGGLGMAGGAAVLGGLVAGPALAIMGFIVGAKASENLDKAKSNYAEATKAAEELNAAGVFCNGIRRRSAMFERLLIRLEALFIPLVFQMEAIVASSGVDFQKYSDNEKKAVGAAASIAKAIKTVLDTPILTEDGKLTEESEKVAGEMKSFIEQKNGTAA